MPGLIGCPEAGDGLARSAQPADRRVFFSSLLHSAETCRQSRKDMCPAQRLGKRGELQGLFLAEDRPARPGLQLVHPTISAVQPLFYPALFLEAVRRHQTALTVNLRQGWPELVAGPDLHCPSSEQTCWRVASRLVRRYGLSGAIG